MIFAAAQLAPLLLLLSAAETIAASLDAPATDARAEGPAPSPPAGHLFLPDAGQPRDPVADALPFSAIAESLRDDNAEQVRIEQRVIIRIAPRGRTVPSDLFLTGPTRTSVPRTRLRKIGKCVTASAVATVRAGGGDQLLLYMRDERVISATLESACSARAFYSGFYVSPSADGKICVDRETLQSRSGTNCKLRQLREVVELGD